MKDNIANKNLLFHLFNDFNFTNQDKIMPIANDIKSVYAKQFCNNDLGKAKELLDRTSYGMKQADVAILSYMFGGISIFMVFMAYLIHLEEDIFESKLFWNSLKASSPVMRFTFMMCYALFGVGVCIAVYRKNEINYMHIF